jgi:hypothetical protein
MKFSNLILLSAVLLAGCATKSTPQSRQHEHAAAYAALTPEQRSLVDSGQIKGRHEHGRGLYRVGLAGPDDARRQ